MEEGGGGGVGVVVGRRLSLLDQMSAVPERRDSLAGLTLDAILSAKRPAAQNPTSANIASRTLLDIIRDEDPTTKSLNQKDRRSWKIFRDRLRLKRAGAAWTSSLSVPASDVNIQNNNNSNSNPRSRQVRFQLNPSSNNNMADPTQGTPSPTGDSGNNARPQLGRRGSTRFGPSSPILTESNQNDDSLDISMPGDSPPSRSFRPQISRHNSTRLPPDSEETSADPFEVAREGTRRLAVALAEERALSAREAVAAQEAAEAEAAAQEAEEASPAPEEPPPVRMSLMDLLEETDRQMGLEGSRYTMGEEEEEEYEEEEEEAGNSGGMEYNCCVCMVRHKGAAFIPCGHTFCRLCSRELWVQRGNCPVCNGYILEILDIF